MSKVDFNNWLVNTTKLSSYSIGRYANAIDTLSNELGNYGLNENNLYAITNVTIIDHILSNPQFQEKNKRGNRMYSAALNYLKMYIEQNNDKEFQDELLKEELEFEKYLTENHTNVSRLNIEDKPKDKPNYRLTNNKRVWSRNPRYASEALASADYLCEFDNQHKHFISKFNKKNYVEAHHLIPMQYQEEFDCSLDIHANIVSICLVCHKQIHFGFYEGKKEILDKLFADRKERLRNSGIEIQLDQLYSYYQD